MEHEKHTELETERGQEDGTALQVIPTVRESLARSRRGSEYIQNLAIIGLFVIAIFAAITALKTAVETKFNEQATAVTGIPGG
jgi:hypothetical protein